MNKKKKLYLYNQKALPPPEKSFISKVWTLKFVLASSKVYLFLVFFIKASYEVSRKKAQKNMDAITK